MSRGIFISPAICSVILAMLIVLFGLRAYLLSSPIRPQDLHVTTALTSTDTVPHWAYLPAAKSGAPALVTTAADFAIVQQNGSYGQSNLPVNLYGQYLKASGNFTVTAVIEPSAATCTLAVYDSPPFIADEFRIEPTGLHVRLTSNAADVEVWSNRNVGNPYKQAASKVTHVSLPYKAAHSLTIRRQAGTYIVIGDARVIVQTTSPILRSGNVWFGFSGSNGPCRMASFQTFGDKATIADTTHAQVINQNTQGLQSLVTHKRSNFVVGAAVALGPIVSDSTYQSELFGNFGYMTPENAMKWQFIEPQKGIFTFQEADALVAIAQKQHMAVHGHTLVFSEANPSWVTKLPTKSSTDKQNVQSIMTNHVSAIVSHYKGKVTSWDVINEPLADYDQFTTDQPLRQNIWLKTLGSTYIATALKAARQADPNAKLFINEYGLEEDGERWDSFIQLVNSLKKDGVPLDGVGFQAHVYDSTDTIDPVVLNRHFIQLAKLGLVSRISEMDVYDEDGTAKQADQYTKVFNACLYNPNCVSFTTWGVDDRYDKFIDDDGTVQDGHDLLFNYGKVTPAYTQLQKSLQ